MFKSIRQRRNRRLRSDKTNEAVGDRRAGVRKPPGKSHAETRRSGEMKGGNEVSEANGITQFANGEPKRRNNDTVRVYQPLEGGNGGSEANVVTLRLATGVNPWA